MLSVFRTLWRSRRLLKDFVVRDLKARYVGSSMGFFWSVVFPIINLFVYMFVFRVVLNTRWSDTQGATEVALVMLAGIVVWSAFAETISRATNCLVDHANLIKKVVFPSELLPAFLTISSLVNMCIGLPVVLLSVAYLAFASPPDAHVLVVRQQIEVPRESSELGEGKLPYGQLPVKDKPDVKLIWEPAPRIITEGGDPFAIKLQLSQGQFRDTVLPLVVGGDATPGVDYQALPSEVIVPAGHVEVSLLVHPLRDTEGEDAEFVTLSIGEPDWAEPLRVQDGDRHFETTVQINNGEPLVASGPDVVPAEPPPKEVVVLPEADPTYYPLNLGPALLALPLLLLLQGMFTVGLGFFLSTLNVFLRDTYHLVGVGITVWMFATPIFYPARMVREAGFNLMLEINPMYWIIESYRMVLLHAQWPDPWMLARFAVAAILVFIVGASFFKSQRSKFPDLL